MRIGIDSVSQPRGWGDGANLSPPVRDDNPRTGHFRNRARCVTRTIHIVIPRTREGPRNLYRWWCRMDATTGTNLATLIGGSLRIHSIHWVRLGCARGRSDRCLAVSSGYHRRGAGGACLPPHADSAPPRRFGGPPSRGCSSTASHHGRGGTAAQGADLHRAGVRPHRGAGHDQAGENSARVGGCPVLFPGGA